MMVKCPKCGKESPFSGNPFRPFCSERCKLVDLGDWLSGTYGIPIARNEEDDPQPETSETDGESGDS